ncbi:MAG: hypothetical protein P8144_06690, partial [Gammaproteobacteria bacterium]
VEKNLFAQFHKGDAFTRRVVQATYVSDFVKQYVQHRALMLGKKLLEEGKDSELEDMLKVWGMENGSDRNELNETLKPYIENYIKTNKSGCELDFKPLVLDQRLTKRIPALNEICRFALTYCAGVKRWKDKTGKKFDKDDKNDKYTVFDLSSGGVKDVEKDEKVKREAELDMNWAVQCWQDEKLKEKIAAKIKEAAHDKEAILRLKGELYNSALYGLNPHDPSRHALNRVLLRLIGEHLNNPEQSAPARILLGPCGAPQVLWNILNGPLSANRHVNGLTSLYDPHCGDFHEIQGLQGDAHDRTYMKVKKGTRLYESYERLADAGLLQEKDADGHVKEKMRYDEDGNIIVPVDCVHSQFMLNCDGAEREVSRNLVRALGYENVEDAEAKISGVSCGKDGADVPYDKMKKRIFGEANGTLPMTFAVGSEKKTQELITEGLEFTATPKGSNDKKLIGLFTQNHDDAFHCDSDDAVGDEMMPFPGAEKTPTLNNKVKPGNRNHLYHEVLREVNGVKKRSREQIIDDIHAFIVSKSGPQGAQISTLKRLTTFLGLHKFDIKSINGSSSFKGDALGWILSDHKAETIADLKKDTSYDEEKLVKLERDIKKMFRLFEQYKHDLGGDLNNQNSKNMLKEILSKPEGEDRTKCVNKFRAEKNEISKQSMIKKLCDFHKNYTTAKNTSDAGDTGKLNKIIKKLNDLLEIFESDAWAVAALKSLKSLVAQEGQLGSVQEGQLGSVQEEKLDSVIETLAKEHTLDVSKMESTLNNLAPYFVSNNKLIVSNNNLNDVQSASAPAKRIDADAPVHFYPRAQSKLSKLFRVNWKNGAGNHRLPGGVSGVVTGGTFLAGAGMVAGATAATVLSGVGALFSGLLGAIGYQVERDATISDRRLNQNKKYCKERLVSMWNDIENLKEKLISNDYNLNDKLLKVVLKLNSLNPRLPVPVKDLDELKRALKEAQAAATTESSSEESQSKQLEKIAEIAEVDALLKAMINTVDRIKTYSARLENIKREKNDNFFGHLTGRGYLLGAGMMLASAAATVAAVFTPVPALVAGVLGVAAFVDLAAVYFSNAMKSNKEVHLNDKAKFQAGEGNSKVVGYRRQGLFRFYDRSNLFKHMSKSWLRGGLMLTGMAALSAGFVAANVFTAGAPLLITGAVLGGAMLLTSVPLFKDTFQLFNRYATWKTRYARGNDTLPHVWGKNFVEDKKEYWNLSKQNAQVGETNMRIMQEIDNKMIAKLIENAAAGKASNHKVALPGRAQNSRNKWSTFMQERFLSPNRKAEFLKQAIQGKADTGGLLDEKEQKEIVRPLIAYNMLDYTLLEKNSLVFRAKCLLEELTAFESAGVDTELMNQVKSEYEHVLKRLKGTNAFLAAMDKYQDSDKMDDNCWRTMTSKFIYHLGLLPQVLGSRSEQKKWAKESGIHLETYKDKHIAHLEVEDLAEIPQWILDNLMNNSDEHVSNLYAYVLPNLLSTEVSALYERDAARRVEQVKIPSESKWTTKWTTAPA